MSTHFTQNYRDHSSDTGFQFEFFCDHCRSGHRSTLRADKLGILASLLRVVSALTGGSTARLGYGANQVKDAFRGSAWSKAYGRAIEECRSQLKQCPQCSKWVCGEACWNVDTHRCRKCS